MTMWPNFPGRVVTRLDGTWDGAWLGEDVELAGLDASNIEYRERLPVPGCFDCLPGCEGKRGTMAYRTVVDVTPGRAGLMRFGGIGLWAAIYVDGRRLHICDLPYSGFDVEVPASEASRRELTVVTDNRFDDERVVLMREWYDFYGYGGIYRPAQWHEVGATWIDRAHVETLSVEEGRIRVTVLFGGAAAEACDLTMRVDEGEARVFADTPVRGGRAVVEMAMPGLEAWDCGSPRLHVLTVMCGGETVRERFGLRTIGCEGQRIVLNGEPVRLFGYCRHEAHPQFGAALPEVQMVHDLRAMKAMGCNVVRGSHYPLVQRVRGHCDEMGVLVWEETLGWGYREEQWSRPDFLEANLRQARLMVKNSFNHPSVAMWGIMNEGGSHLEENRPIYEAMIRELKEADGTRLATYASNRIFGGAGDRFLGLVDVVGLNAYPGWYEQGGESTRPLDEIVSCLHRYVADIDASGGGGKPLIISEIGAGAIYGWRDPHRAHWSEEYQRDLLETVCREIVNNDRYAGVTLWQFCDTRTYDTSLALRRPRAFNNKGTFDEYRRPKPARDTVAAIFRSARKIALPRS